MNAHLQQLSDLTPEARADLARREQLRLTFRRAVFGTGPRNPTPQRRTITTTDQRN